MPYDKGLFKAIDYQITLVEIAYLEHELLPGPYVHTDLCRICYPRKGDE